ncbi:hypothetical protein JZ785_00870 [Alicyclobacillus curvatus]|nr:hypothetical protein JZ785_00870 [Alicyclobacillus curvatus]
MKRHRLMMTASIASSVVGILVGCATGNNPTSRTTPTNATNQVVTNIATSAIPSSTATMTTQIVNNVVIADTSLPGYSGQRIQLIDVKGEYVDNTTPGPYPAGSEWTGKFALRVIGPTGKLLSSYPLPSFYSQFHGQFQFHFADYTGNGLWGFALGQYASSNGYNYELFEVAANGIKPVKTTPAQIFTVDHSYSPLFHKASQNAFVVEDYNNAKAKYEVFTFVWKDGQFMIDHKQTSNAPVTLSTHHQ